MHVCVEVWGDYACFSRPEMKVERVSYDVMTPSAARGILDAIYWHPGMKWHIDRIRVCSPIRFTNVRRNEVDATVSARAAKGAMNGNEEEIFISTNEHRQQRASLLLKDVHYVIEAHFEMTKKAAPSDNPKKFLSIFNRRLEKGSNFAQPCLGLREFPANYQRCDEIPPCPEELRGERDLGWMLLDLDFSAVDDPASGSDEITPTFFRAVMKDGVIEVPSINDGRCVS